MSRPATFARGLLVTTSLAGLCLATPAFAQYATQYPTTTHTYGAPTQSAYAGLRYQAPASTAFQSPAYGGPQYQLAQGQNGFRELPEAPQSSPSDLGAPDGSTIPPRVPPPVENYPVAPVGPTAAQPYAAQPYTAQPYAAYQPSCNCLDGGQSTWGLWGNYTPTSPCRGGNCGHLGGWLSSYNGWHPGGGGGAVGCAGPTAGCADGCGAEIYDDVCCVAPCRTWFGGVYALYMTRDNENDAWTSFDSSNIANQVLNSQDASDWQTGNEVRFGSTFVCHCWGWEAVYWGLYEESETAEETSATVGAPVSTVFDFGGLDYDDGVGVSGVNAYFDGAEAHRIRRHFEVQNLELNLIYYPLLQSIGPYGVARGGPGALCRRGLSVVGTMGIRYFRVDEGFQFATSPTDFVYGDDPDDLFYDIEMENHLIGLQLGAAANYQATQRFSLYADSKFGVYGNYIEHDQRIYGSNGLAVVTAGLPYAGTLYDLQSDKDDVAFLGELRLGAAYQVSPHWRLYGGWRAIGVVGYAHPTAQIPLNFAGTPDILDIDSNGSLIVHGLQTGVELNY